MIFISYTYNYSSKPSTIVTSFLKSGQFFLTRSTNLLFGLVGLESNPVLRSKPKLVLTTSKEKIKEKIKLYKVGEKGENLKIQPIKC